MNSEFSQLPWEQLQNTEGGIPWPALRAFAAAETDETPVPVRQAPEKPAIPIVEHAPKPARNAPCPCGSGKKYKKCHGRPGAEQVASR